MTHESPHDAKLDELLDQWQPLEPDDGFASRVMSRLALADVGGAGLDGPPKTRAANEAPETCEAPELPVSESGGGAWWRSAAAVLLAAGLGGGGVFYAYAALQDDAHAVGGRAGVAGDVNDSQASAAHPPGLSLVPTGTLPVDLRTDIERHLEGYGRHYGPAFAFSGVVLAARGDQVVEVAMGHLGVGRDETPDADTPFRIASLTQPIVATAAAIMVEKQQLSLDEPIAKCGLDLPQAWGDVTIQQLMAHRSGIPNMTDSPLHNMHRGDVHDASELWNYVGGEALSFAPGSDYEPSNTNYVILGACLASRAGTSLDTLLQELVFEPAGMTNARMGLGPAQTSASGMTFDEFEIVLPAPRLAPSAWAGAGGVSASANDLLALHRALRDERLLSREVQDRYYALTHLGPNAASGYGMGWTSRLVEGDYELGHPGGFDGFNAQMTRRLVDDTFVVVLMNHDSIDARQVAASVMRMTRGESVEPHKETMEVALDPQRVPLWVGEYRLSEKTRQYYAGAIDPQTLEQMNEVKVEFVDGRLWMNVRDHGAKWMHAEGGDRFFFKDLAETKAVFGMPAKREGVTGAQRASYLSLRSGELEFMLLRKN